jgi:hypothetical protein
MFSIELIPRIEDERVCLIAREIENYWFPGTSIDLKPAVVQNIIGFIVIEAERSATKY